MVKIYQTLSRQDCKKYAKLAKKTCVDTNTSINQKIGKSYPKSSDGDS